MSSNEYIVLLGIVISFLISILGYLFHRLISNIDESIKSIESQQYKDAVRLDKMITSYSNELKTMVHIIDKGVTSNQSSLSHLQKRMDELQHLEKEISELMVKVISTETKLEQLGKIIHVGRNGK